MPVMLTEPVSLKVKFALSAAMCEPKAHRVRPVTIITMIDTMNA